MVQKNGIETDEIDKLDEAEKQKREVHVHFLKLLKEEAKRFEDPLLIYLYDMVIHRTTNEPD